MIRNVRIRSSQPGRVPEFGSPDDPEVQKRSLESTIRFIKACAVEMGGVITDGDITIRLMEAYRPLIDGFRMNSNRKHLVNTIELIRNHGLAQGMDITADEMATKAGTTVDTWKAYLFNGLDTQEDWATPLIKAYEAFPPDGQMVEIRETIRDILL